MVRPKLELDEEQIYELAAIHCTTKEIASVMKCSVDTLDRRYADLMDKGRDEGKMRLRRAQIQCALKGNATMLIFLGKNMLNQKDNDNSEKVSPDTTQNFTLVMNQLAQMQKKKHNTFSEKQPSEGKNEN